MAQEDIYKNKKKFEYFKKNYQSLLNKCKDGKDKRAIRKYYSITLKIQHILYNLLNKYQFLQFLSHYQNHLLL